MKLTILLFSMVLLASSTSLAQVRKAKPKPPVTKQTASSTDVTPEEPKQKVVVEKINGDRLTGLFMSGSINSLSVLISGSKVSIPFEEIASVHFSERAPIGSTPPIAELQTGTLAVEAAILYKMGGPQPIARVEFSLLDKSLDQILSEAGGVPDDNKGMVSMYGFSLKYSSMEPRFQRFLQIGLPAVKSHTVAIATTDFSGKTEFTNIKPGTYWITAYTSTRGGFAIWNLKVNVPPGPSKVFVDSENADLAM